ncbi:MAG: MaoC family dehydratase [Alphaproteobacteria bacterium]
MTKTSTGNFFEDFSMGQKIAHATPRTVTEGDVSLYIALTGSRFAVQSADTFAMDIGYPAAPVDDCLVFNMVFGKSVPDISLNAIANLGYADCRFLAPVFPGDTLSASSQVIGLRQLSNGKAGVVYVRTTGVNQADERVLDFVRWVMVSKRDESSPAPETHIPELPDQVAPDQLAQGLPPVDARAYDLALAGAPHLWGDFDPGEKIDHVDAMTIEEAEHQSATRLYQNTAKVHFNAHAQAGSRFGKRLIYGGHVISLARALSFNGLANVFHLAAINSGAHVAPCFAGDTIYAWSEILQVTEIPGREDAGALRIRTVATKDHPCADFPYRNGDAYEKCVLLDLDYWAVIPRA